MKTIPTFSHHEESPKIMAVWPPYAPEEVAICRDSELRAFIVRACNSHAALVAALEKTLLELRRAYTAAYCGPQPWTDQEREQFRVMACDADMQARTAIASARGDA